MKLGVLEGAGRGGMLRRAETHAEGASGPPGMRGSWLSRQAGPRRHWPSGATSCMSSSATQGTGMPAVCAVSWSIMMPTRQPTAACTCRTVGEDILRYKCMNGRTWSRRR